MLFLHLVQRQCHGNVICLNTIVSPRTASKGSLIPLRVVQRQFVVIVVLPEDVFFALVSRNKTMEKQDQVEKETRSLDRKTRDQLSVDRRPRGSFCCLGGQ